MRPDGSGLSQRKSLAILLIRVQAKLRNRERATVANRASALIDRVALGKVQISDPQSDPQRRCSYTTSVVLGVPHGFVSR